MRLNKIFVIGISIFLLISLVITILFTIKIVNKKNENEKLNQKPLITSVEIIFSDFCTKSLEYENSIEGISKRYGVNQSTLNYYKEKGKPLYKIQFKVDLRNNSTLKLINIGLTFCDVDILPSAIIGNKISTDRVESINLEPGMNINSQFSIIVDTPIENPHEFLKNIQIQAVDYSSGINRVPRIISEPTNFSVKR